MNAYKMHAFTLNNELYEFQITDVPTYLKPNKFALLKKPGSPILSDKYICRYSGIDNIFEGDIVLSEGVLYIVYYFSGFRALSADNKRMPLYQLKDPVVVGNMTTMDFPKEAKLRANIRFKYRGNVFFMEHIVGLHGEYAIINSLHTRVDPSEIQQEAGFTYNNSRMFFGDLVNGRPLILKNGVLGIEDTEGFYDITTEKYISF